MAPDAPASLRKTPLHAAHVALGARMTPFGGWDMPLSYTGQLEEHRAVRERTGLFDVSHMGQVRLTGPRVLAFLQLLVPGDYSKLTDGQAKYTQLCNERGGVIDDLIISRLSADEYFAVVNASTREGDVEWIRRQAAALGFDDLAIEDESDHWAMIAVQGPQALALLDRLIPARPWSSTQAFTLHSFLHDQEVHYLSRTGYTGEVGGELICPAEFAEYWWKKFLEAGAVPCGLAARDSLRLEAGYCLYGNDLGPDMTPIEAGLGWSVNLGKPESFVGRAVIEAQKKNGAPRRLVGVRAEGRRPLRHGDPVVQGDRTVGEVTSGGFSPGLNVGIGLALVQSDAAAGPLAARQRGGDQPVSVVKPPFVKTSLSK